MVARDPRALPLLLVPPITRLPRLPRLPARAPAAREPRVPLRGDPHALALARDRARARGAAGPLARGVPRRDRRDRPVRPTEPNRSARTTLGPGDGAARCQPIDGAARRELRALGDAERAGPARATRLGSERLRRYLEGAAGDRRDGRDAAGREPAWSARCCSPTAPAWSATFSRGGPEPVRDARQQRHASRSSTTASSRRCCQLRELQRQLEHQAFHDSLTGLANRALFINRVEQALASRRAGGSPCCSSTSTTSRRSTTARPRRRRRAAGRGRRPPARMSCAPGDTVARLGGDEFAVLLDRAGGEERRHRWSPSGCCSAFEEPHRRGGRARVACTSASASRARARQRQVRRADPQRRRRDVRGQAAAARASSAMLPPRHARRASASATASRASSSARSSDEESPSSTSRSSRSPTAAWWPSRRWCAGTTPSAASCRPREFIALRRGDRS